MSKKYTTNFLEDTNGSTGSANQVLVSTAAGVDWVDGSGSGIIGGPYLKDTTDTFTGSLTIVGDIRGSGQQLILNAGESYNYATAQASELVYLNAEAGLQVNSSPDNWSTGWAGRNTAFINRADASSSLPGDLSIAAGSQLFLDGGGNTYIYQDVADRVRFFVGGAEFMRFTESTANDINFFHNTTISGDLTVSGGDITLGGATGRIQGIDTISSGTDAVNRNYVDTEIGNIPSGLAFEGNWNASTDTPTLAGTTQDNGKFWIVSVAGSTNLSGITDWAVGDWAIYVDNGAGTDAWQKVDNSSTLSGLGAANKVAFWSTTSNVSFNNNFSYDGTNLTVPRLRVGDGTDGYFYSDSAGRTAFTGGNFYIQSGVSTYYNYANTQYHGNSSGDNHLFRGNPLSGNNWSITAAGAISAASTITASGGFLVPYTPGTKKPMINLVGATNYGLWHTEGSNDIFSFDFGGVSKHQFFQTGNAVFAGDLTVSGGDIVLGGTGRIQGVDTVSASTDAANKAYVDNAIAGVPQGTVTGSGVNQRLAFWNGTSSLSSDDELTWDGVNLNIGTYAGTGDCELRLFGSTPNNSFSTLKTTNGNLHIDSDNGHTVYLNYYSGGSTSVIIGNGAGGSSNTVFYANGNATVGADLTVSGGDIILSGTGRIQGVDTVSAGTDAANKAYVDLEIATRTPLNDIRSLGATAFTNGANPNITTAQVMAEIEADGGFDSYSSVFKTSWSYAGNYNLTDAGDFTETAGSSWITWTDNSSDTTRGNITALAIAPTTGGSAGGVFIYNDQGGAYSPGWRQVWTNTTDGAGSGLDADLLDGQQGSYYLDYANFTGTPTIPSVGNGQIDGRTSGLGLSGSMDATANQSGNTTFTVTSDAATAANASTIAYRTSSADIRARLFRSNYANQSTISGGMAFRVNNGADDYIRFCSDAGAIRTFLGVPASGDLNNYLLNTTDTFTGALTINGDIRGNGQQLVLNAGESYNYATGQTSEYVFANAENGLIVSSSPDNWASGWAGRNTAYINRADASSYLPGDLYIEGADKALRINNGTQPVVFLGDGGANTDGQLILYSSAGAANVLFSGDNQNHYIANGNVGIGTTSPTSGRKLDVHGDIETTTSLWIGGTSSTESEHKIKIGQNRSGNGFAYIDLIGDAAATSYYNLRLIRNNTGVNATSQIIHTGTGNFSIDTSDSADIILNPGTANVGIGTTSPNQKLHVNGATQLGDINSPTSFGTVALKVVEGSISTGPTLGSGTVGAQAVLYSNGLFGMYTGVSSNGDTWMQSQRNDASTAAYNILLNPAGGKVGIGTTTPGYTLDVDGNASFAGATRHVGGLYTNSTQTRDKLSVWSGLGTYTIGMKNGFGYGGLGGNSTGTEYAMSFQMSNSSNRGWWWGDTTHTDLQGAMSLTTQGKLVVATSIAVGAGESTRTAGTSKLTVVAPLSSNGVGTDFQIVGGSGFSMSNVQVEIPAYGNGIKVNSDSGSSLDDTALAFYQGTAKVGSIVIRTSDTLYSTTSDYRLKENKENISDAIERVKALKPVKFNWISEPNQPKVDGFYAHELAEVVPEAVTGEKDALDYENNPDYQSIDQSKIVPLLSAALQQAIDKIELLEQRIQSIENK